MIYKLGLTLCVLIATNSVTYAQKANAGSSETITSGEAGSRAGTSLYNSFNKDHPLPNSSGSVVQDTMKNMGAGKSAKEAWKRAAESNSAAPKSKPKSN